MLGEVVPLLRCPVCHGVLSRHDGALRCGAGHSHDIARQGHVTLLAGPAPRGDTTAMAAARARFLEAGHYDWLADLIVEQADHILRESRNAAGAARADREAARAGRDQCVVDAGAGVGFYLAAMLRRLPGDPLGVALDSSRPALRRAARAHPRIGAVGVDLWRRLPIADGSADLVLNVFAPRNGAEFHRILRPDGALFTVTPNPSHLAELVRRLGLLSVDETKQERLDRALGQWFAPERSVERTTVMTLDHHSLEALAEMGPSAWHVHAPAMAERIRALPTPVAVAASCQLTVWRPRPTPLVAPAEDR
ncbi:MAG: putative RNA methyltransferase [Micromonosporaceae bacterium]